MDSCLEGLLPFVRQDEGTELLPRFVRQDGWLKALQRVISITRYSRTAFSDSSGLVQLAL